MGSILFTNRSFEIVQSSPLIQNPGPDTQETNPSIAVQESKSSKFFEASSLDFPEDEEPLVFTLPDPGEPMTSYWRPPLYDTPFSLSPNDHFFFSRPIAADEVNWPLADYRYGYFFPDSDIVHTGIDIDAPRGTPVIAAAPGKVIWAGFGLYYGNNDKDDPYGLAVTIQHDFGYAGKRLMTVYAHMDRIDVEIGQEVKTGTPLGIVGNTGNTTGPHLHFEVRLGTNNFFRTRNPELWLAPPQGWGVLVGQVRRSDYYLINLQEVFVRNKDTEQTWMVRSYAPSSVNADENYQENLVLSDLPAGEYSIYFYYNGISYKHDVSIFPGAVTYFKFQAKVGFSDIYPVPEIPNEWADIILTDDFPANN